MKKKITVILIVLLVVLTLFSACNGPKDKAIEELSTAISNGYNATQVDYSQKVSRGDILLSSVERTYVKVTDGWEYNGTYKSLNDDAYGDMYIENKESGTSEKPPLPAINGEMIETVNATEGEEVVYEVKLLNEQLASFLGLASGDYEKISDVSILISAKGESITSVTLEYAIANDRVACKINYIY